MIFRHLFMNLFLLILLAGITGCSPSLKEAVIMKPVLDPFKSQAVLYLNGPEKTFVDISFVISGAALVSMEGDRREIINAPSEVNSLKVKGRQLLLGEISIPEGIYKKLILTVDEASLRKADDNVTLALPSGPIEIPVNLTIDEGQSEALFLKWNPEASIVDGFMFSPNVTVINEVPELSSMLIYVTNEDSGNVSVINRQSGEVVGCVKVGHRPRGIAAGLRKERQNIYVANSGSNSVSVINAKTSRVEREIPIRLGSGPEAVAVAGVSSGRELVLVANYNSNTVSVIDPLTFNEIEKVQVGNGPVAIAVDPPVSELFGSRFLELFEAKMLEDYRAKYINAYVANRNSNSISVIKINIHNNSVVGVRDIDVEWGPVALSVDYPKGKVYVANNDSDRLSLLDIVSIVSGDETVTTEHIENIGTSAIGVSVNNVFDRVYILKEFSSEVVVIKAFSESADNFKATISPAIARTPVGDSPRAIMLDPEGRKLYVVNTGADTVSVISATTAGEEKTIPVGRSPYGIAVFSK